jgi:hypothetical protein
MNVPFRKWTQKDGEPDANGCRYEFQCDEADHDYFQVQISLSNAASFAPVPLHHEELRLQKERWRAAPGRICLCLIKA